MKFIKSGYDRWNSGPYVIAKYTGSDKPSENGFYVYRYFKYKHGGRDSKRLHPQDEPLPSFSAAKSLCKSISKEPVPVGIVLINAPF